jgi:type II secretory pathway pseudopilin PulG
VLAVLVIISIVSAVAVPRIDTVLESAVKDAAVRELVTDLRYARQMALTEGRIYYIAFNKNMQTYQVSVAGKPTQIIIKQVVLPDGIRLLDTTFTDDKFYYNSMGAPSRGGTIELLDRKNRVISITVLPATGRVRIYR